MLRLRVLYHSGCTSKDFARTFTQKAMAQPGWVCRAWQQPLFLAPIVCVCVCSLYLQQQDHNRKTLPTLLSPVVICIRFGCCCVFLREGKVSVSKYERCIVSLTGFRFHQARTARELQRGLTTSRLYVVEDIALLYPRTPHAHH